VAALAAQALARRGGMPLAPQIAPHASRQLARQLAGDVEGGDGAADWTQGGDGSASATRGDANRDTATLRSTLDARLQRLAVRALRQQLNELWARHVQDGAVVVLDNASGQVLAWVGSAGESSSAPQVDGVLARRQPGSTLKPFVYGLALEQRLVTAATLLDDSPAALPTGGGLYQPRNHDGAHHGAVSVRTALAASLNIPAVRVASMLAPDALFERLNTLGLALPHSGGFHGLSLALGSADVTLLALANAYRTLANGGHHSPVVLGLPTRTAVTARTGPRVLDPAAAFVVTDILADRTARALTFGLDSVLATRGFAAVKTGTSKDMRDSWCVGFTAHHTVAVWVGNAGGEPMRDVSGVTGAAPVWRVLIDHLQARAPSPAPRPPPGVQARRVEPAGAVEPPRREWFVDGSAPTQPLQPTLARAIGISHPVDGSVFAIDPDVPSTAQRIAFEGAAGTWVLNGQPVGEGSSWLWTPSPGRHTLRLKPYRDADRDGGGTADRTDALPKPTRTRAHAHTHTGTGTRGDEHAIRFEVRGLVRDPAGQPEPQAVPR
jgi:penicillin-binding protein 1C